VVDDDAADCAENADVDSGRRQRGPPVVLLVMLVMCVVGRSRSRGGIATLLIVVEATVGGRELQFSLGC